MCTWKGEICNFLIILIRCKYKNIHYQKQLLQYPNQAQGQDQIILPLGHIDLWDVFYCLTPKRLAVTRPFSLQYNSCCTTASIHPVQLALQLKGVGGFGGARKHVLQPPVFNVFEYIQLAHTWFETLRFKPSMISLTKHFIFFYVILIEPLLYDSCLTVISTEHRRQNCFKTSYSAWHICS